MRVQPCKRNPEKNVQSLSNILLKNFLLFPFFRYSRAVQFWNLESWFFFFIDSWEGQLGKRNTNLETTDVGPKSRWTSEEGARGANSARERGEAAEGDPAVEATASRQERQRGKEVWRLMESVSINHRCNWMLLLGDWRKLESIKTDCAPDLWNVLTYS